MGFLRIIKKENWGTRRILVPWKEIKAIEIDEQPHYAKIYYLNTCIEGFFPKNTLPADIQENFKKEFCYTIFLDIDEDGESNES